MTIWKFKLMLVDHQKVRTPIGADILSVGEQDGDLYMWAIVNPTEPLKVDHHIYVFGTGNPLDPLVTDRNGGRFVGTVQMANGLVWHVFRRGYSAAPSESSTGSE